MPSRDAAPTTPAFCIASTKASRYDGPMEDLDLFLADFGVPITAGAVSGVGIFDMPSEIVADGVVLTTDYRVTAKASEFGDLLNGSEVSVNGAAYTVRNVQFMDDGKFVELMLQRSVETSYQTSFTALDGDEANSDVPFAPVVQLDSEVDGGGADTVYAEGNVFDGGGA
jgi:hypothetical protein